MQTTIQPTRIEYHDTRMTRQTREDCHHLLALLDAHPGNVLSFDWVDPQAVVGHVCLYVSHNGHYYAESKTADPRNLHARLKRQLRVKVLHFAVSQ